VKLESENPGGSVKDRLALGVIEWAEKHGQLKPGQTVVEATSGNTGIGLAMVCASKGYPLVVVMSEAFSIERRKLMRFLGARVILTNPAHKGTGMVIKTKGELGIHARKIRSIEFIICLRTSLNKKNRNVSYSFEQN
jgi:cysteine synthase A